MTTRKKAPGGPSLETVLERIDRQSAAIESLRVGVDSRFGEMQGGMDARFAAVDSRLEKLQGSMDFRFVAVDSRLEDMQASMAFQFQEVGIRVDSQTLLLEDMRAQNRATIEAVEASRRALEETIEALTRDTNARIGVLDAAIKHLAQEGRSQDASLDLAIRDLKVTVQQNSVDIRDLAGKIEALTRLEERVAALERRIV